MSVATLPAPTDVHTAPARVDDEIDGLFAELWDSGQITWHNDMPVITNAR